MLENDNYKDVATSRMFNVRGRKIYTVLNPDKMKKRMMILVNNKE